MLIESFAYQKNMVTYCFCCAFKSKQLTRQSSGTRNSWLGFASLHILANYYLAPYWGVMCKEYVMYKCPHCDQSSISFISKFLTGPIIVRECPECYGKWGISWISMFWVLSSFLLVFFGSNLPFLSDDTYKFIFVGGCILTNLIGLVFFTPITKK
jgi:hypothetical protein